MPQEREINLEESLIRLTPENRSQLSRILVALPPDAKVGEILAQLNSAESSKVVSAEKISSQQTERIIFQNFPAISNRAYAKGGGGDAQIESEFQALLPGIKIGEDQASGLLRFIDQDGNSYFPANINGRVEPNYFQLSPGGAYNRPVKTVMRLAIRDKDKKITRGLVETQ